MIARGQLIEPGPLLAETRLEFGSPGRIRLAAVLEQARNCGHGQQRVGARSLVGQRRGQVPRPRDVVQHLLLRGQPPRIAGQPPG
jgi:hypothetical protein